MCGMMRWMIIVVAMAMAGCATLSPEDVARGNYGPPPPSTYQDDIKAGMSRVLRDPHSAMYRFEPPRKAYAYPNGTLSAPEFGWIVLVLVNAKNGFGGYTGEQPHWFFFQGSKFRVFPYFGEFKYADSVASATR